MRHPASVPAEKRDHREPGPSLPARDGLLNRALGLVTALFGAILILGIIPAQAEDIVRGAVSPRDFPTFAAGIMVVFGLVQAIYPTGENRYELAEMGRAALVVGAGLLTLLLMTRFGYIAAAPALAAALMLFAGERRPLWLAVGVVAMPGVIWTLFEAVLRRPLP